MTPRQTVATATAADPRAARPPAARKMRGDFATPPALVELVVEHALPTDVAGRRVRVLDPACGDGRFLIAAGRRLRATGAVPELHGVDIDAPAVATARRALAGAGFGAAATLECADALARRWRGAPFDVVVGNPPYLSQLAAATTRGGASVHGGGPYADACAEFLALAVRAARVDGGRVGLVLPQSILASRDAAAVRADVDALAELTWSWWSPHRHFDAEVLVCALVFARRTVRRPVARSWTSVVTTALRVPSLPPLAAVGSLGDRARLTANFRDQYYGLVPAVADDAAGPSLVTSGLVDPGRSHWSRRPVTFARRRFTAPRVDLARLAPPMRRWADAMLVPKVLVANQTRVIEAVADPAGAWLPGVPMITARPTRADDVHAVEAVLTSPVAAAWAWHRAAGTGLSARVLRLGPRLLGELPWPAGPLDDAVAALAAGDVEGCGSAVGAAYGVAPENSEALDAWWRAALPRP